MLRRVVVRRLVEKIRGFGQDQESVREALRDPELALVLGGQVGADPFAEGGRALSHVYGDVEHLSRNDPDQLALRLPDLVVKPAQYISSGAGVIVLREARLQAGFFLKDAVVQAFKEKAALVAEHFGLDDEHAGNFGLYDIHFSYSSSGVVLLHTAPRS